MIWIARIIIDCGDSSIGLAQKAVLDSTGVDIPACDLTLFIDAGRGCLDCIRHIEGLDALGKTIAIADRSKNHQQEQCPAECQDNLKRFAVHSYSFLGSGPSSFVSLVRIEGFS